MSLIDIIDNYNNYKTNYYEFISEFLNNYKREKISIIL